jgi:hypothetical protein
VARQSSQIIDFALKGKLMFAHMVYFTLKQSTPASRAQLVEACKKYLADHPGVEHFSVGVLADAYRRDVNDRNFDVALHLVFENNAAHDAYQVAPRHQQFIAENKANWASVRVFDAEVE